MANFNHNLCFVTDPIFVDWSDWSVWGGCSESCGGGVRLRQRFCNDSLATESTDVTIRCSGPTLELEDCNEQPCPSEHQHNAYSCNYRIAITINSMHACDVAISLANVQNYMHACSISFPLSSPW